MKLIIGIIKPLKLEEVCTSLLNLNIEEFNVTEVKGFGRQKGIQEHFHGGDYASDFIEKIRIEVTIKESLLIQTIKILQHSANSGKIGDGKIFIYEVN
jgi:nitrogen regulatory protein PII